MQVSIREVLQLAERCFAAAGFPKGIARANAESIWWTEAYRGSGLDTLHDLLDDLKACDHSGLDLRDRSATVSVIDGRSQPSIVASHPVLNLASSQASQQGIGLAYATTERDDTSISAIGHVAYKAAERGMVSIVAYDDGSESGAFVGTPTDSKPLLAAAEREAPPSFLLDVHDIGESGNHQQRNAPVIQAFFDRSANGNYDLADELLVEQLLQRATASSSEAVGDPGFALLCLDPHHQRLPNCIRRVPRRFVDERETRFTEVFRPERIRRRVETLMDEGVAVDRDVWEDVFEYNTGVLAPPFEGSEQGAGFGLND